MTNEVNINEMIQHNDGRVELQPYILDEIEGSPLYNEDLAPVPVLKRNWTTSNHAAFWISMPHRATVRSLNDQTIWTK